jgi:hypothetical protein
MQTLHRQPAMATTTGRSPVRQNPRFLFLCLALCFLSTGVRASTVEMTFTGVNGVMAFNEYVGPYSGAINSAPLALFCLDINNHVSIGQQWEANLTPITAGADLGATRYVDAGLIEQQFRRL